MTQHLQICSARPEEREAALHLIFQQFDAAERERRTANALQLMELGKLCAEGLFTAHEHDLLQGSMLCLPIPGASGLVWPPQSAQTKNARELEDALVSHSCEWLKARGAKLAQALLFAQETASATPLERNGFQRTTTLWYMRRDMNVPLPRGGRPRLTLQPYDAKESAIFSQTLLRTYEGTQDCPEVNGVRTIDEILDGHSADAGANFSRWWLALDGKRPVGVMLAAESPEWESWEIAYIGVVPEARGRGFGRELMHHVLTEARVVEVPQLTLCVDSRNAPAVRMYRDLGFERYDTREVYLRVLDSGSPSECRHSCLP
jgi:ribosomal protein S18 acetylase RimI-like enzyme